MSRSDRTDRGPNAAGSSRSRSSAARNALSTRAPPNPSVQNYRIRTATTTARGAVLGSVNGPTKLVQTARHVVGLAHRVGNALEQAVHRAVQGGQPVRPLFVVLDRDGVRLVRRRVAQERELDHAVADRVEHAEGAHGAVRDELDARKVFLQ